MATNEEIEAAKEQRDDIVIVDGIRYRKADAPTADDGGGETETATADTADTEKKTRTTAANKARTSGEGDKG